MDGNAGRRGGWACGWGFLGLETGGIVGGAAGEKGETYGKGVVVGDVGISGKRVGVLGTGAPSRVSSDAGCWVWLVDSIASTMISILSGRPEKGEEIFFNQKRERKCPTDVRQQTSHRTYSSPRMRPPVL